MARPNPFEGAQEIQQLLVDYAKQETIAPLKTLGRYLGMGMAGSLLMFVGLFFIGLGTLRLLQTFEVFSGGSWASTLPYLITIVTYGIFMALIALAMMRSRNKILRQRTGA